MEHGKRCKTTNGLFRLRRAGDELGRLARHVHHAGQLLGEQPVDVVGERRVGLDVRLQGAGEELLRHRLFNERPLGLHPAAASRKLALQIGNDATVGPGNEADQLIRRTAFAGDDARPRAAAPILRAPIQGQCVRRQAVGIIRGGHRP
ncbi:hypothetical protein D9M72_527700 [compost metagenome]